MAIDDKDKYDKVSKSWDDTIRFYFRHRHNEKGTRMTYLSIGNMYRFGIEYKPVYSKVRGKEDRIMTVRGYGFIQATNYRIYDNVYYRYIFQLRKLLRKVAKYRLIKKELVTITKYNGEVVNKYNCEYVVKLDAWKHFSKISKLVKRKKRSDIGKKRTHYVRKQNK